MKPFLLFSAIFLLVSATGYSQRTVVKINSVNTNKKENATSDPNLFTGIGLFKIGTDTAILVSYATTHVNYFGDVVSFEKLHDRMDQDDDGTTQELLRLKPTDSTEGIGLLETYCSKVTEFYLSRYEISGIVIKNIRLKYFKNKLVEFKCDYSKDIEDALTVKYSKPHLKVTTEKFSCMHNMTGITTPLEAKTYSQSWNNGPITATSLLWESYDDHCQKSINQLFYYTVENAEWKSCEDVGLNQAIHPIYKRDKKNLKDF